MYGILATSGETATPTAMQAMLTTMNSVLTFAMSIFSTVLNDPILSFIVAGSLVGIGINVLRQVKSVASA